jgi:hypothetical protein
MTVNHFASAEKYLSQASWLRGTGPEAVFVNPESAAILAALAGAHATLAQLPEQQAHAQEQLRELQRDLAATQRIVGAVIAETLIDGKPAAQELAHGLAYALRSRHVSVDAAIENRMEDFNRSYDADAAPPVPADDEPVAKPVAVGLDQAAFRKLSEAYRDLLVRHVAEELQGRSDDRWAAANALASRLDDAGLNIDDAVDYALELSDMGQRARKRPSQRWPEISDEPPF